MERGSDKHGPRLDENLAHDTRSMVQGAPVEARADEAREQEGAGDGDPRPDSLPNPDGNDWVDERADLARHLDPSAFPASAKDLVANAAGNHAPASVVDALGSLPADQTFQTTEEVWEALGGQRERRT